MNVVYIGTSLDGHIADKNGGIDWLSCIPNPDHSDFGFADFMSGMDALVMGRNTFETVLSFDGPWPYAKHVFVLSNTLKEVPEKVKDKATVVSGDLKTVVTSINENGYKKLYIDGGKTIQSFLREDLIDEMIITTIPVVLGSGTPLFNNLDKPIHFDLVDTEILLGQMVKHHYRRIASRTATTVTG
jgi:dihydrofolate reductase